jgi:hypothetical protein
MHRKSCSECPWKNKDSHSQKWPIYVSKISSIRKKYKKVHGCHMKTSDVWGMKTEIDEKNVCVGSLNGKTIKDLLLIY